MEKTLLRFVWRHSWRDQLVIVAASLVSFPLILASLYVPKIIVNDALRGTEFPQGFLGLSLGQIEFLIALCISLLTLILLNNGVKYFINVSKGLTGERILRRLRYTIFERVIRFPLARVRNTSPSEVVQIMVAEVEPLGGFSGEVIASPVYLGGQLIVYVGFIIAQDPFLGLASIILFPVQAVVVPRIQRVLVRMTQTRIRNTREMTAEISEAITGIGAMRLNGAEPWHLARVSERLYTNFSIRYRIFFLKFAVKFANNVINHITPFFFYSFGGYLVIVGRMDLGALVAILAAYKDIAAPWRDLLSFYQTYSDISARYEVVYATIGADPVPQAAAPLDLSGQAITLEGVASDTPPELGGVTGVSLSLPAGTRVAVLGNEEAGRSALLAILSGLAIPSAGEIVVGAERGRDILTRAHPGIAQVTRQPHIHTGTFRENVAYGVLGSAGSGTPPPDWPKRLREARITGATPEDPAMDWVDYARLGLAGPAEFDDHVLDILAAVGLQKDLFARGLSTRLDPARAPHLVDAALRARAMVEEEAESMALGSMIEHPDRTAYLENASLAENLLFGVPDTPAWDCVALTAEPEFRRALVQAGIEDEVVAIGREAAGTLVELLASVGGSSGLIDQIGLVQQNELDPLAKIVGKARQGRREQRLDRADRALLMRLALRIVPQRHRLGTLDDPDRRARIIAARAPIAAALRGADWFHAFDDPGYVPGLPLIENILGGRPRLDRRDINPSVEVRLERIMVSHDMHDFVTAAGLRTPVGLAGNALSPLQKRRLALARAITARPALLILDGILDDLGPEQPVLRAAIDRLLPDATVVIGTGDETLAAAAGHVVRVEGGRVAETAGAGPRDAAAAS